MILQYLNKLTGAGLGLVVLAFATGLSAQERKAPPAPPVIRSYPVERAAPPPILIARPMRRPSVDIRGVSNLEFAPDQSKMAVIGEVPPGFGHHVDLYVGEDGKPLRCVPISKEASSSMLEAFCGELMRSARVRLFSWYDLAGQEGRIGLRLVSEKGATHKFTGLSETTPSSSAPEFSMGQLSDGELSSSYCRARSLDNAVTVTSDDAQAMCEKFADNPDLWKGRCRAVDPANGHAPRLHCRVELEPITNPLAWTYRAVPTGDSLKRVPRYVGLQAREAPILSAADGKMSERSASRLQYPSRALRMGLQGRVVALLGVSGDGRAQSCRPLESSGSHELDYRTCQQLVRYARYEFGDGMGGYTGLKYQSVPIRWTLPE